MSLDYTTESAALASQSAIVRLLIKHRLLWQWWPITVQINVVDKEFIHTR